MNKEKAKQKTLDEVAEEVAPYIDEQRLAIATAALQGLLSSAPVKATLNIKGYVQKAVEFADALIAELKKPTDEKTEA